MAKVTVPLQPRAAEKYNTPGKLIAELFYPEGYVFVGVMPEDDVNADKVRVGNSPGPVLYGSIEYIRDDKGVTAVFEDAEGQTILTDIVKRRMNA